MKTKKRAQRAAKKPFWPCAISGAAVSFDLSVKSEGLEPIMGAAYLLTDRTFVSLKGDRSKRIKVTLRLKTPCSVKETKLLAETFRSELRSQKVRWAIAKNNLPIREYIAEQAIQLANGAPSPAPASPEASSDQLTAEQRGEIEKLIAEVEEEIKAMNQKKAVPDPKNIKASWEEKQETKSEGHAGR